MSKQIEATPVEGATYTSSEKRTVQWILAATFILAAVFLFANLGHYALWDDEAGSALGAESVVRTGDTKAMLGHNLIAYRQGFVIHNMRTEGEPPFNAYVIAPFFKILGENAFAARLPFALFGLGTVGILLRWIWEWRASPLTATLLAIGLLGNVSFFLYSRQCRYYAPAAFFFAAIVYWYVHWKGDKRSLVGMGLCSAFLLSANYSFFILLYGCLLVDYLIWQHKIQRFKIVDLTVLFLPSFIMGLVILTWWNPFHTQLGARLGHDDFWQRLTLFFWHWRDLNRCEMLTLVLMLFTPWIAIVAKEQWLRRGAVAMIAYFVGLTIISTQTITDTSVSDVRYFSPILLLFIAVEVFTLKGVVEKLDFPSSLSLPFAVVIFGTNFFHGGLFFAEGLRITPLCYIGELLTPPRDPYTETSKWINQNVKDRESIWVCPSYMTYPLMFHAPKATYAWQLKAPPQGQFKDLPSINFEGAVPPDYIIAFGPSVQQVVVGLNHWKQAQYRPEATLNVYWHDMYRPELFWRKFEAVKDFNPAFEAIYIFKLQQAPFKG